MLSFKVIYRELREPILRAAYTFAAVVLLTGAATYFNHYMRSAYDNTEQALRDTVFEFRNAIDAERILMTQTSRFEALRAEGFIGPEPRLRWIEDVREIAQRTGLVSIKYQLGARAVTPTSLPTATYQLYASPMKLDLQLRHEGDLLTFLNLLEGRRGGLFELASCSLSRESDAALSLTEANVMATCRLLWYSLDTPQAAMEGDV